MKKWISLLLLLLACAVVLSACNEDKSNRDTDTTSEHDDAEPTTGTIWGYWSYSNTSNSIAMEITKDSNAAKFYSLQLGYYEYYAVQDATYTYDEEACTLILTLEGVEYEFLFDEDEDTMTLCVRDENGEIKSELEYTRRDKAPTEHPSYSFPKYSELNFDGLFTLPDYKSYALRESAIAEARIEIFTDYYSTGIETCPTITDRPAQFGDLVIIDYVGTVNGVAFSGGTAYEQEISILYNSGYIPGFAEGIIGHSVGETFEVPVTFPENYGEPSLAGVDAVFTMTLHTIYDVRLSDAQFSVYENMIYDTYEDWVTGLASEMVGDLAFTTVLEDHVRNAELPEESYQYFYQYSLDYAHMYAHQYGLEYELACQYFGFDDATFLLQAKNTAIPYLISEQIFRTEGLSWTEEEYEELFASFVQDLVNYGYSEEDAAQYVTNNQMNNLYAELTYETVVKWLGEISFR